MNVESLMVYTPSIFWRIKDPSDNCTRIKVPEFSFLGGRWKFKYDYYGGKMEKGIVYLKISEGCVRNINIHITATINSPWSVLSSEVIINPSESNRFIIWELRNPEFKSKFQCENLHSLIREYDDVYLKFDINEGSGWPTLHGEDTKKAEAKTTIYSPCVASLCHDFGNVFNNHLMSDVILECEGMKIHAHRIVLAARSEVFAAMFRNDMREAKENVVAIQDVEPSVLEQMVRYMYSGGILDLTADNVHKVYAAADKYGVDALKMKCGVFMVENPEETIKASTEGESGVGNVNDAVLCHFANVKSLLSSDEWKKLAEKEPKFAHGAFQFFISKSF